MDYDIIPLLREEWKGYPLPIGYITDKYYDVSAERMSDGFVVKLSEKHADPPIIHTPEEYGYPDRLYQDACGQAVAWGILRGGELLAAVEVCPESWGNRMRITELWVHEEIRHRGIGHALVERARAHALSEGCRALILETQSCNHNAIGFYLHEGFGLIGFDSCFYANNDIQRREVRLEFGMLLQTSQC